MIKLSFKILGDESFLLTNVVYMSIFQLLLVMKQMICDKKKCQNGDKIFYRKTITIGHEIYCHKIITIW